MSLEQTLFLDTQTYNKVVMMTFIVCTAVGDRNTIAIFVRADKDNADITLYINY